MPLTEIENEVINTVLGPLQLRGWPVRQDGSRVLLGDEKIVLEKRRRDWILRFYFLDSEDNEYKLQSGIHEVRFNQTVSISRVAYFRRSGAYKLSIGPLASILRDKYGVINNLHIKSNAPRHVAYSSTTHTLTISSSFYEEILDEVLGILDKARAYKGSVQRYLLNQLAFSRFNREIQNTTTIQSGEFNFLVHRLNLETKRNRQDFDRYLNDQDVNSLQSLFSSMLHKEVFGPEYLRFLDDYFIKEKLTDIISAGESILDLRSVDLTTNSARAVIEKLGAQRPPRQLETVWQRYFEKNLLYLIFSYREFFPKIKLRIDGEKRYPDFIGINHYLGVDAIEIKHHLLPALVWDSSHHNFSFSSSLSKAIIQVMNYLDAIKQGRFTHPTERQKITETTNIENLYHPRGVIIISSWNKLVANKRILEEERESVMRDFTILRNSLHDIEILTFDEVIGIARNYEGHFVQTDEGNL